ncbi:(R)-mandelonitrile lyase [Priestia megaterium]|uniref:(R)-mandelonitrile lyase n=1 Tax=Priestia megaterium TaxID=1404 RepID=UPI003879E178
MKKILTAIILLLSLLAAGSSFAGQAMAADAKENSQTITRGGSQASSKGSAEFFTGNVRIDPLFSENDSAPYTGGYVTFQPGARSAWHTHPTGQRLIVTEGVGWVQEWGGPIEEIREGDVVWCPPGVKHWHGATPTTSMTHIALTGMLEGNNVEWLEKVSDEQYGAKTEKTKKEKQKNETQALTAKQENIVTIAALTASGELPELNNALNEGLDAGLTVNEIKEVLVQMYAYAGFPRSLNGLNTFMGVMEEREAKGIKDEIGKEASPLPVNKSSIELGTEIQTSLVGAPVRGGVYTFTPVIDQFLKGHLFGDIFGRDNLDYQSREIATIAALANMEGVNSQLQAHFNIGFNTGLTEAQMSGLISVLESEVGKKEAKNADKVLDKVLSERSK